MASSVSTLSDADSDITLNATERISIDGEHPKLDSLSPSEEQAVRALEDLRADTTMSSPAQNQQDFLNRMQSYTIVNTAVKAWDQGKNYNRALKWGGEMVESVVGGVVQRLEPLEPFANRQLDRVSFHSRNLIDSVVRELSLLLTSTREITQWNDITTTHNHFSAALSDIQPLADGLDIYWWLNSFHLRTIP